MYNANLDTSHPSSMPALRAQLATSEAARKRDKEKGKDANVEALKTKEGFKQHVKEQQSEFERLRQDILERRKKGKHGGAVDTAIEVE
jgi:E3 ubiquitin-protein ligase RAD18